MAKKPIRKTPTELTHADIYLDDLFEIEDILSNEYKQLEDAPVIKFEYEVDDKVTLTTREDLKEHDGSSSSFSLNIVDPTMLSSDRKVLRIYSHIHPTLDVPHVLRKHSWEIFGKVDQVFESRRSKFKIFDETKPEWIEWTGVVIASMVIAAIRPKNIDNIAWNVVMILIVFGALSVISRIGTLKKNKIYFRYAREDEKNRSQTRKDRIEKIVFMIIGMLLGIFGTLIEKHLTR